MKYTYLLVTLLVGCSYQSDNFLEIHNPPTIDQKLMKLTDEIQRLRRDMEIHHKSRT